jgi:hypothetical protein
MQSCPAIACIVRKKQGVLRSLTRGSTLHKIHLTSSITRWLKDFTEAMRREDLSPVTVRGYLSELEMFMA